MHTAVRKKAAKLTALCCFLNPRLILRAICCKTMNVKPKTPHTALCPQVSHLQVPWVCKPAYLVPVPSQDKVGGLRQEGHPT